ncbi:MAG: hypothetical protein CL466_04340 [Acidimicrobiaceae bacterium]|nr:hypothetical protein [Acidimicrobiaceae bacterium]
MSGRRASSARISRRLAELLPSGAEVVVTRDVKVHDRYGRLLGHLASDNRRSVNRTLVEDGSAATLQIEPKYGMHHDPAAAEARARSARLGLRRTPRTLSRAIRLSGRPVPLAA